MKLITAIPFEEFDKIRFAIINSISDSMTPDEFSTLVDGVLGEREWHYTHTEDDVCQCDECQTKMESKI